VLIGHGSRADVFRAWDRERTDRWRSSGCASAWIRRDTRDDVRTLTSSVGWLTQVWYESGRSGTVTR